MKSSQWLEYQKLELIPASETVSRAPKSSSAILAQVWQSIIRYWTTAPELRVWQSRRFKNQTVWHAYDPITGDFVSMGSEAEMRQWIEQRYSH